MMDVWEDYVTQQLQRAQQTEQDLVGNGTHQRSDDEGLGAQIRQLREALAQQEHVIATLQACDAQQQAEIGVLRARLEATDSAVSARDRRQTPPVRPARDGTTRRSARKRGDTTSRRKLLAGAGAKAAAATVALVASEQHSAHAASAVDGNTLQLGSGGDANNTASTTTTLAAVSGSTPSALFKVDASESFYSASSTGPTAILGITGALGTGAAYAMGVHGASASGYGVYGSSSNGYGVYGTGAKGVYGTADSADGVEGVSASGTGVHGVSTSSYGLRGESTTGWGMLATSSSDWGVVGSSGAKADLVANGTGRILQNVQTFVGAPSSGNYSAGESIRDKNGDLYLCVAGDGSDVGTWVKVAHLTPGATTGGATTYLSKPVRLLDTRNIGDAFDNGPGGPLAYNGINPSYTLTVAGDSFNTVDVPASAVGAIGNVTVVAGSSGGGYVALVPSGAGFAGTSNINYAANQIIANCFIVGLSPDGKLDIYVGGFPTDVIIDLFAVVS